MSAPARTLAAVLATLLAASCGASRKAAAQGRLGLARRGGALEAAGARAGKDTPVQRVVKLLQEMKAQLDREASKDGQAYDKMVCWCETNDKAKTKAVADAEAKITELTAEVASRSGRGGELSTKIAQLKKDLAAKKEALDRAVAIREKEHAAFTAEENELTQAITMLKNAILVLSKHHAGLIQMTPAVEESVGSALRWAALKHEELLELNLRRAGPAPAAPAARPARPAVAALLSTAEQALRASNAAGTVGAAAEGTEASAAEEAALRALRGARPPSVAVPVEYAARILASAASAAQGSASFAQQGQPTHMQSYSPQSGQIYGILKEMEEEFEADLSMKQKEELRAREDFAQLKASAERQIAASTTMLDDHEEDFASNTKALSDAKEDLDVTREARGADVQFLSDLRLKCQALDHDWKTRSQARSEEIKAVAEAIAILSEDDARDLFHKKMGTGGAASLLQVRAAGQAVRGRAAALLMRAAGGLRAGGPVEAWHSAEDRPHDQLAAMAVKVQLDAFTKVKKAIDDMVAELKSQQEQEVKHKAFCTEELNDNEKVTYATQQTLEDIKTKIGSLEATIQKMTEGIEAAKEEIAAMEVQVKKAGEVREAENLAFQEEVTDQRAMQNILKKAIARLRMVYKKQEALAQEDPAPPVQFQPYKQNAGASSVISLIEAIVGDSAKVEQEAMAAEQEAQKSYELMVQDSTASIKGLRAAIEEKSGTKASAEAEREEALARKASTETKLEDLGLAAGDLHAQCDFVLKNFEIRQRARLQEIEALQGAKALLSGMSDDDAQ